MIATYHHPDLSPVALLGGVYGNVPALQAVISDAARCSARLVAFLGDATGCCGHSDEAVTLIRRSCGVALAGNHDREAARGSLACGCGYRDSGDERWSCLAHEYAMGSLSDDNRSWLGGLPDRVLLETAVGRLLLFHGSPDRTNEFLYESELDDRRLEAWLDAHEAAGLVGTHTGLPWVRELSRRRFAVNAGVVGRPDHDGDPAVHYAVLTHASGWWVPTIRRVEYDHRSWAEQLAREGVDPIFTKPLLTGIWTTGVASLPAAERHRPEGSIGMGEGPVSFRATIEVPVARIRPE
jgi:hypothetical protein